jgi:hypothetical protein
MDLADLKAEKKHQSSSRGQSMHQVVTSRIEQVTPDEPLWRTGFVKANHNLGIRTGFDCLSYGFTEIMPSNSATTQADAPRHSKSCTSHLY